MNSITVASFADKCGTVFSALKTKIMKRAFKNRTSSFLCVGDYNQETAILSHNDKFKCIFQNDGNLVVYQSNGIAIWASNTNGSILSVQEDGNIVIYDSEYSPVWNTGTNGFNVKFSIDNNGALSVITEPKLLWRSINGIEIVSV